MTRYICAFYSSRVVVEAATLPEAFRLAKCEFEKSMLCQISPGDITMIDITDTRRKQ